jgi:hypothetical protein
MEGLRIVRVIVVDDQESEALEIIKALWARRIPALYLTGEENFEVSDRLQGVRLAFLDMDLNPGAQNEKNKMATLIGALKRTLSEKNGPYIVIAWTKHLDYIPEFEKLSLEYGLRPLPVGILGIRKMNAKMSKGILAWQRLKLSSMQNFPSLALSSSCKPGSRVVSMQQSWLRTNCLLWRGNRVQRWQRSGQLGALNFSR